MCRNDARDRVDEHVMEKVYGGHDGQCCKIAINLGVFYSSAVSNARGAMSRGSTARVLNARDAWDARLAARREHRATRFAVKTLVVAFVAAIASTVGSSDLARTDASPRLGRSLAGEPPRSTAAALHGGDHDPAARDARPARWQEDPCSGAAVDAARDKCAWVTERCASSGADSWVDWRRFHYCTMASHPRLSLLVLTLVVLLAFLVLGETAEEYFCPQVREMARRWRLSPSAAGVTLLALGNGAPDVFASLAAFSDAANDHPGDILGVGEMGTGVIVAVVSAGLFVSGLVVGVVAVVAGPFRVQPAPFLFDAAAYLVGLIALFAVVRDGRVVRWEAATLPAYYVAFVAATLGADVRGRRRLDADAERRKNQADVELADGAGARAGARAARDEKERDTETDESRTATEGGIGDGDGDRDRSGDRDSSSESSSGETSSAEPSSVSPWEALRGDIRAWWRRARLDAESRHASRHRRRFALASTLLHAPLEVCRRATIPSSDPRRWNRFYAAANAALTPPILIRFAAAKATTLTGATDPPPWPPWAFVFCAATAATTFATTRYDAPPSWWRHALAPAFAASVVWISGAAAELLASVAALGGGLGVSPAVLGVTVLAWGNSAGDLVADVVVARSGEPMMAVAACYSGPLFNAMVGLGLAFSDATAKTAPEPLPLPAHDAVTASFAFLFVSLVGSVAHVARRDFWMSKGFGWSLVAFYAAFVAAQVAMEFGLFRR